MNSRSYSSWLVTLALGLSTSACYDAAWIKEDDETDLVDATRGGIEVWDRLTQDVTYKLLGNHLSANRAQGPMTVAFIGVENSGAEEMRDAVPAMYENIDTILVNEAAYTPVSRRFVETAMNSTGMRPEDLFLRNGRERFVAAVTREGIAPDYLLFARVTTLSSEGVDEAQRNYQLTMELVDANSGETVRKETGRVRKGYER